MTAKPSHEDIGTTAAPAAAPPVPPVVPVDAAAAAPVDGAPAKDTRNTGPGRLLIAVYAVFAISATARA
ncbi:MAG: hypothetical protein K0S72_1609, partial [Arthrobacter sp.]|nr:hypothetical protein [Arthrobacter sp.]